MSEQCCGKDLPLKIESGTLVHRKTVIGSTRVSGVVKYVVTYISDSNVVVCAYRIKDDSFIGEYAYPRYAFDATFEPCPGGNWKWLT